jgi:hypothetical protein
MPAGSAARASRVVAVRRPLYPVCRSHLEVLSDEVGIWQHARGTLPDRRFGYCTDDVARLLVVDVLQAHELGWAAVDASVRRSLAFVEEAFDAPSGRFRNLRDARGRWLEADRSEDCHARALVGLAAVAVEAPDRELAERSKAMFDRALPAAGSFGALRPMAAALLACVALVDGGLSAGASEAVERLAGILAGSFDGASSDLEWPWPEPVLTYENALPAQALIVAGVALGRPGMLARGCAVLDWLIDVQLGQDGCLSPVGNKGWWPRGGPRSRFDQQPIEAATLLAAAAAAARATGGERYLDAAESAYGWFLGDNDVGVAVADPASGSCHDGLQPLGLNPNRGAESTLMWLTALDRIRQLRRASGGSAGVTGESSRQTAVFRAATDSRPPGSPGDWAAPRDRQWRATT